MIIVNYFDGKINDYRAVIFKNRYYSCRFCIRWKNYNSTGRNSFEAWTRFVEHNEIRLQPRTLRSINFINETQPFGAQLRFVPLFPGWQQVRITLSTSAGDPRKIIKRIVTICKGYAWCSDDNWDDSPANKLHRSNVVCYQARFFEKIILRIINRTELFPSANFSNGESFITNKRLPVCKCVCSNNADRRINRLHVTLNDESDPLQTWTHLFMVYTYACVPV